MTVCINAAGGHPAYHLLSRIVVGDVFGEGARVNLRLVDDPNRLGVLEGLQMEIDDCAAPCVGDVTCVGSHLCDTC